MPEPRLASNRNDSGSRGSGFFAFLAGTSLACCISSTVADELPSTAGTAGTAALVIAIEPSVIEPFVTLPEGIATNHTAQVEEKLPAFAYHREAAAEAEAKLRRSFNRTRSEFLEALFTASKHRRLTPEQVLHPGFERFVQWFRERNKEFPLTGGLAEIWATGEPDDYVKERLAEPLRKAMAGHLVTVIPDDLDESTLLSVSNLQSVADASMELARSFEYNDHKAANYVAQFVRANWVPRTPNPSGADSFELAPVVRANEALEVTARLQAAEASRPEARRREFDEFLSGASQVLRSSISLAEASWQQYPELCAGLPASALAGYVLWIFLRRSRGGTGASVVPKQIAYTVVFNAARNETVFLPVKAESKPELIRSDTGSSGALIQKEPEQPIVPLVPLDLEWQDRVLAMERRAEELMAQVRAGLAPHLAKEMMNALVHKLISDREGLLHAHSVASAEVARIEQRFAKVHAELRSQLAAYHARTVELEKELAVRTEQNIELLKGQIAELQKKVP